VNIIHYNYWLLQTKLRHYWNYKTLPFRRAKFASSATLQAISSIPLRLHVLQLAAKANLTREISGLVWAGYQK